MTKMYQKIYEEKKHSETAAKTLAKEQNIFWKLTYSL